MAANSLLLSNLTFDGDQGKLLFGGTRYQIIRPEVITDFQKAVEAEIGVERCGELMAAQSFKGGQRVLANLPNVSHMKPMEKLNMACIALSELGWGRFEALKLDLANKECYVEVANSAFAAGYGPAGSPVCHTIRGLLAGLATDAFGENASAAETRCAACGDDRCRFHITAG